MGLFNRKKKEEVEFNYDEMMAAAKLKYANYKSNPEKSIYINKYENEEDYYRSLSKLLKSNKFSYVHKTQINSSNITEKYEKTTDETNCIGVYDKNNNLLLTFEIDSDKLILYRYLICDTNMPRESYILYEKIDMQPIKNVDINEDLLSNYLIKDVLHGITCFNWTPFSDDITSDYLYTAINMYIKNN